MEKGYLFNKGRLLKLLTGICLSFIRNVLLKKFIVLAGATILLLYLFFRIQLINLSPILALFSIILFMAEMHTILHLYGMFYSMWPRKYVTYENPYRDKKLRINIFICICGEPLEIVRETIRAAKEAAFYYFRNVLSDSYPNVIVLNDGYVAKKPNWKKAAKVCNSLNVYHLARRKPGGFKAGNINRGLKQFPTDNQHNTIDVIFDSDFCAKREFLIEITKPFIDRGIDFVQSPQRYKSDQTWVEKSSAAHQIFFFDHICPAKGHDNALFLCGTNFAIRRSALNDIGGMDTRFITEDYATSLNLHLKGKRGVFMPKVLALGIAPATLKAYFSQQQRWSKGNFDVTRAYIKQLLFGPLTLKQKFHYLLSATYYLIGLRDFILMLAPLPYLFFGVSLIKANTLTFMVAVYGPLLLYNLILYACMFRHPIKSLVLDIISFPIFTTAFFSSLLKKDLGFIVTIKKYERENPLKVYKLQMLVAVLLMSGLLFSSKTHLNHGAGMFINYFWATFDSLFLTLGFFMITEENYKIFNTLIVPAKGFIEKFLGEISLFKKSFELQLPRSFVLRPIILVALFLVSITVNSGVFGFAGFTAVNSSTQATNRRIHQELLVPDYGAYYGYYLPKLNSHPKNLTFGVAGSEKPSLVMFYQSWGVENGFDKEFMESITNSNVIPIITWEPWDSKKASYSIDSIKQPDYSPQAISSGSHDDFIKNWAIGAAGFKKPFFLRFAHEMNGNWYGWGNVNGNKPEDYIKMWRHVRRIFDEEGATNVIWVWSPNNTDENGSSDTIINYYPGDDAVDWVGFTGFNWGNIGKSSIWLSFKQLSYNAYLRLSKLNKPIMVTETSSTSHGGSKDSWFIKTLRDDIPSMPNIKAVIFYNQDSGSADFKINKDLNDNVIRPYLVQNSYYRKNPVFRLVS